MNNTSINLAIKREPVVHRHLRKVIVASVIVFIIVFLLTATSILFNLYQARQYAQLTAQGEELVARIQGFGLKRERVLMLQQRLEAVEKLLAGRQNLDKRFATLSDQLTNFNITDVSVSETKVDLTLTSPNLVAYNTLFSDLYDMQTSATYSAMVKEIQNVDVQDFSFGQTSTAYEVKLELEYKKKVGGGR